MTVSVSFRQAQAHQEVVQSGARRGQLWQRAGIPRGSQFRFEALELSLVESQVCVIQRSLLGSGELLRHEVWHL